MVVSAKMWLIGRLLGMCWYIFLLEEESWLVMAKDRVEGYMIQSKCYLSFV